MGTLLVTTLVAVLVMRKCLNKLHSAEQTQQGREKDGAYEMVESGKPAEAEYEVVDLDEPKEVNTTQNPAYAATTNITHP